MNFKLNRLKSEMHANPDPDAGHGYQAGHASTNDNLQVDFESQPPLRPSGTPTKKLDDYYDSTSEPEEGFSLPPPVDNSGTNRKRGIDRSAAAFLQYQGLLTGKPPARPSPIPRSSTSRGQSPSSTPSRWSPQAVPVTAGRDAIAHHAAGTGSPSATVLSWKTTTESYLERPDDSAASQSATISRKRKVEDEDDEDGTGLSKRRRLESLENRMNIQTDQDQVRLPELKRVGDRKKAGLPTARRTESRATSTTAPSLNTVQKTIHDIDNVIGIIQSEGAPSPQVVPPNYHGQVDPETTSTEAIHLARPTGSPDNRGATRDASLIPKALQVSAQPVIHGEQASETAKDSVADLNARLNDMEKSIRLLKKERGDILRALGEIKTSVTCMTDFVSGVSDNVNFLKRMSSKNIRLLVPGSRRCCYSKEGSR